MKTEQCIWQPKKAWNGKAPGYSGISAQLVLVFSDRNLLEQRTEYEVLALAYPDADIVCVSTSGNILGTAVYDDVLTVTAIEFEKSHIQIVKVPVEKKGNSLTLGHDLGQALDSNGLRHVLLFSDGLMVNGTALVNGMTALLPDDVHITGGLAGDDANFDSTVVHLCGQDATRHVVAIGFYGETLSIGWGSRSGWQPFGPIRKVTRASENVLYELDGESALSLYKTYLGDHAKGLPATGLLFPLSLVESGEGLIRTVLSVDESEQSMTFAGDIPEGHQVQLMKANTEDLVMGSKEAAEHAASLMTQDTDLAILISCVGRKLVMTQRVEEEVEAVQNVLSKATLCGFYSYGEICPDSSDQLSFLHNQTMTITTIKEHL